MTTKPLSYTHDQLAAARHRFREAIALQQLEDNPLTDAEIIILDRGLREGWTKDQWDRASAALLAKIAPDTLAAE